MEKKILLYSLPLFGFCIAIDFLFNLIKKEKRYSLLDSATSISAGIFGTSVGLIVYGFGLYVYDSVYNFYHLDISHIPEIWVLLTAVIVFDFLYYWMHRAHHEVRILWAIHIPHHSSEYLNYSTALRQSAFAFITTLPFFLPMALLGFNYQQYLFAAGISVLYGFFTHTEKLKPSNIEKIFVGPSTHRVHHATNKCYIDKNYGSILSIWDVIFGTYEKERAEIKIIYGTVKPLETINPIQINVQEFINIYKEILSVKGLKSRILYLIERPSISGDSREIEENFIKELTIKNNIKNIILFLIMFAISTILTAILVVFKTSIHDLFLYIGVLIIWLMLFNSTKIIRK
jgi:alkylglycerol monooxygenase